MKNLGEINLVGERRIDSEDISLSFNRPGKNVPDLSLTNLQSGCPVTK